MDLGLNKNKNKNKGNGNKPQNIRQVEELYKRGKLQVDESEPDQVTDAEIKQNGEIIFETKDHFVKLIMPQE